MLDCQNQTPTLSRVPQTKAQPARSLCCQPCSLVAKLWHFSTVETPPQALSDAKKEDLGIDRSKSLFVRHMGALLRKRLLTFRRDKKMWAFVVLMPALFVLVGILILTSVGSYSEPSILLTPAVSLLFFSNFRAVGWLDGWLAVPPRSRTSCHSLASAALCCVQVRLSIILTARGLAGWAFPGVRPMGRASVVVACWWSHCKPQTRCFRGDRLSFALARVDACVGCVTAFVTLGR